MTRVRSVAMVVAAAALLGGGVFLFLVPVALTPVASAQVAPGGLWQVQLTSRSLIQVPPIIVNLSWGTSEWVCPGGVLCPATLPPPSVTLVDCGSAPCENTTSYPVLLTSYAESGSTEFNGRLGHWYGVEVGPVGNSSAPEARSPVPIRWSVYATVLDGWLGLSATGAGAGALVHAVWFNRERLRPPPASR